MIGWISFLLLTASAPVASVIIEIPHFHEIVAYADADTLILLDIDDTLLIPVQMLGNDEWFNHRCQEHKKAGMPSSIALEKAIAEWEAVRHLTAMEIVEPGSEKIVRSLQERGFCMMGLTTQAFTLAARTAQQLNMHQLDLSLSPPCPDNHYLSIDGRNVFYIDGILFTSGASKGKSLFAFCDKIGYIPQRIVFINDKASHLKDVELAAKERQIEFVGLRYSFSDSRKQAFCPHLAHYQFTHSTFHHLLSDEEAKTRMQQE